MTKLNAIAKKVIPSSILARILHYLDQRRERALARSTPKETFTRIYEGGYWGKSPEPEEKYYSGSGSHCAEAVDGYVAAVSDFLRSFEEKPNVVDLGCGDFAVGAALRPYCGRYIAADVVDGLVERNKRRFAQDDIDFRVLDITKDELPEGDVVFLRQVLQHLNNEEIRRVVSQLPAKFRFLVLTEHLPVQVGFVPNLDKDRGHAIRLLRESGVVLTARPFGLQVTRSVLLFESFEDIRGHKGVIQTTLHELGGSNCDNVIETSEEGI